LGFIYCFVALGGALCLWGVLSPRSLWEFSAAWSYKNPEANEPSEAGFAAQRVAYGAALVLLIVLAGITYQYQVQWKRDGEESRYERCVEEHEGEDSLIPPEDWCDHLSPAPY